MALRRLIPEINQMFRMMEEPFMSMPRFPNFLGTPSSLINRPSVDLKETKKNFIIEAELPGVERKDISIECVDDRTLLLQGQYSKIDEESPSSISEGRDDGQTLKVSEGQTNEITHPSELGIDESNGVVPSGAEKEYRDKASRSMKNEVNLHSKSDNNQLLKQSSPSTLWHSERLFGSFQRVFTFPQPIEPNSVNATYRNGLLSIFVPKKEKKGIPINVEVKE